MNAGRRSRLIVVWLVFVVLVGAVILIERTDLMAPEDERQGQEAEIRMLLPAPLAQLTAVEIGHAGTLHRFERDANGAWFYHTHNQGPEPAENHEHQADAAFTQRIDLALAAFGRTRIERDFVLGRDAEAYGIASPEMIVLVYGSGASSRWPSTPSATSRRTPSAATSRPPGTTRSSPSPTIRSPTFWT